MRKQWIAALGILVLALAIGGWAEAVPVSTCADAAGTEHIVDTVPEAAAIGTNGYDNNACHLKIQISIPVTVTVLTMTASDISIVGPDPASLSGLVEIINNAAASETSLIAEHTNIVISEASIKAHKKLVLQCKGAAPLEPTGDCNITSDLSELIASLNFGPPPSGGSGDLHIRAIGHVDIQTTSVHGAGRLEITSSNGSLTLLCQAGEGGCKDPLVSSTSVELCGTCPPGDTCPPDPRVPPAVYPCTTTFPAAADLKAVCIKTPGVKCNGGSVEKRFTAKGDINITGSEISAIEHMTFDSKAGRLLASGAKLTAESLVFQIRGNGTSPSIDLSNAMLNTSAHITITAYPAVGPNTGCPPAPAVCINTNGLVMQASNVVMTANNSNGVIDLCGTAAAVSADPPTIPPQAAGATLINDLGTDFSTINGDSTPPFSRIVAGVETILNGAAECTALAKFGAYIDCSGPGGSCPPGIIDP